MDKKRWKRAALPAFLFGLCMICPQMQVSAVNAKTGVTSVGSIVYEDSAGCAAIYAEDIACLKEKLSSVRAEVYNPGYYGNVRRWEYEILPENEAPKAEYPALPEEVKEPEETEVREPGEPLMPEDEKMPEPDETTVPSEEIKEPGETEAQDPAQAPAPEDTETPEPDETTVPSEEIKEPGETEAQAPAQAPAPEDTETPEQEKPSVPEDTEDKGGAENQ